MYLISKNIIEFRPIEDKLVTLICELTAWIVIMQFGFLIERSITIGNIVSLPNRLLQKFLPMYGTAISNFASGMSYSCLQFIRQ